MAAAATTGCGGGVAASAATTSSGAPATLRIAIANNGTTTFDGKPAPGPELTNLAREAVRGRPGVQVVVDAERDVSFQNLMSAVEKVRAAGVTSVSLGSLLATQPAPGVVPEPTPKASGPAVGATPELKASIAAGTKWDCAFPPPAERNGKEEANVLVIVNVDIDGRPISVDVQDDPGGGFGAAARRCAMEKAYVAPRDVNGKPVRATTMPFVVRFVLR
jgi:hypothetical protein